MVILIDKGRKYYPRLAPHDRQKRYFANQFLRINPSQLRQPSAEFLEPNRGLNS